MRGVRTLTSRPLKSTDELIPIDIDIFRKLTRDINFDVYMKLSSTNCVHIFSRTTGIDYKRLAQYIHKGTKQLYIRKDDKHNYEAFISHSIDKIICDPNATKEKKVAALLNMTEQNMAELFVQLDIEDKTAKTTRKLVKNYIDVMTTQPDSLAILLQLASHGDYLYYHSIAVSILSMYIAKATGNFDTHQLELIGFGAFLHDVGCTQLPTEVTESPTDLTPEQWEIMRTHPRIGLKMLEKTPNIPTEVRYIVYQHHEEPSGKGYPNNLFGSVIYFPARIVAIADCFSALISKRPYRDAFSVEEALKIIKRSSHKYPAELITILVDKFGNQKTRHRAA